LQKNEQDIKVVNLRLPEELVKLIDQYKEDLFIPTRHAAVLSLIEYALRTQGYKS
jgi:hypothetical protein